LTDLAFRGREKRVLPAEEGIPTASATLTNERVPLLLAQRTLHKVPKLAELKAKLICHQVTEMVVDLPGVVRRPRDQMRDALKRFAEHVMVILVALHALLEQRVLDYASRVGHRRV
jgi:hypothetical protein